MRVPSFNRHLPVVLAILLFAPVTLLNAKDLAKDLRITEKGDPVDIEADELIYEQESQLYRAHGRVEVTRGDLSLRADHVQLHMVTKDLTAWGNVILRDGEDVVECERLEVNLNSRMGKIYRATLFLKEQNFHITGEEVEKLGENQYRVREGSFTTCDGDRPAWKFSVSELDVTLEGYGIVKSPTFYIKDIPVLYSPIALVPVRRERQTGLLLPEVGYSDRYGPEIKTAFYWAMAKDMDSTFYLSYLGDRGFKEGLEYRYAFTEETKGGANFYFIDDHVTDKNRYAFFVKHQQKFPYDFYIKGDINYVSDNQYPRDFDSDIPEGTSLDARSLRLLRSVFFGGKNWDRFSLLAGGTYFDNLTVSSNDATVQKLPELRFFAHPQSLFHSPFFWNLDLSYINFYREKGVEAHRWDLFPRISYPVRFLDVFKLESSVGGRETFYRVYSDSTGQFDRWESRTTMEAGVNLSTEFYRVYQASDFPKVSNLFKVAKWMHTIEPKVGYRYSPRVNQRDLPVFDEADRIPYLSEITYGITQRLVGRPEKETLTSGPYEYARLTIFQSYSAGDPYLDPEGKKRSFSNIRSELWCNLSPYLSAQWEVEFNPYQGSFDLSNFLVKARDLRDDVFQVQYLYTKGRTLERREGTQQINFDTRIKTIPPLYVYGSYRYDLLNHWRVATIFGAEYQAQCWSLGLVVEDWGQSPTGTQRKEVKVRFYVNLLNLGSVGHKPYHMIF